jgi:ParB-like chromosome segregation protein Spo0J
MATMTVLRHDLTPVLVPIDQISRHPENYNHGDVEEIEQSMEVNGLYTPLVVQASTGYILVGNHRYESLLALGEPEVPVIRLSVDDDEGRRILAVDNRLARKALVDITALQELLGKIAETDSGLIGTGFVDDDFDRIVILSAQIDEPYAPAPDDGVRQRNTGAHAITCPSCGYEFGGHR